jgi:cytoskeletal protein CcmA (bactofilin family)
MIRMGRNNREEPENTSYQPQPAASPAPLYSSDASPAINRNAMSESDSMARDIKEGRLSGYVGNGTTLTGETEFSAMLRVDGHLVGTVTSEAGTLIVGNSGQVDANVIVAAAMISGAVNGDIFATEKLQLGRTARVMGNIQSPRLIIEEGAILEGSCSMLKARESQEAPVPAPAKYEAPPVIPISSSAILEEDETPLFESDDIDSDTAKADAAAL